MLVEMVKLSLMNFKDPSDAVAPVSPWKVLGRGPL